ncbi:fumarylacetoacetate hydrolase family protein [Paraburkholderia sp. Se-20369]|nr:fumarylacetoacetate hydrolase family protein [Paraburkholderia sp. Se-20369]
MKLATSRDGKRDGQLLVVSRDLREAIPAASVAPTMLHAIENWSRARGALQALSDELNAGRVEGALTFDPTRCTAPLTRAPRRIDALGFVHRGRLIETALRVEPIPDIETVPLMVHGASDVFASATERLMPFGSGWSLDFGAGVAIVVDDVPAGIRPRDAIAHIRLLMLANDVGASAYGERRVRAEFGALLDRLAMSFAPVAVTPDELGDAWQDGRVRLPIRVQYNGMHFGEPHGGDMSFSFGDLVAHAARLRGLCAGTVVTSGPFSSVSPHVAGTASIAERRAMETIKSGKPTTQFMQPGDCVRIEMLDAGGRSVFGAIEQELRESERASSAGRHRAGALDRAFGARRP